MCVLIIEGKKENKLFKCGMDIFAEKIEDVSDVFFFNQIQVQANNFLVDQVACFKEKLFLVWFVSLKMDLSHPIFFVIL